MVGLERQAVGGSSHGGKEDEGTGELHGGRMLLEKMTGSRFSLGFLTRKISGDLRRESTALTSVKVRYVCQACCVKMANGHR